MASILGKRAMDEDAWFEPQYKERVLDYVDPFELMMLSSARYNSAGPDSGNRSVETACCTFCDRSVCTDDLAQCDNCQGVFCRNCRVTNYESRDERTFCLDCHMDQQRNPGSLGSLSHSLTSPITPAGATPFRDPRPAANCSFPPSAAPAAAASSPYSPLYTAVGTPAPPRPYSYQSGAASTTPGGLYFSGYATQHHSTPGAPHSHSGGLVGNASANKYPKGQCHVAQLGLGAGTPLVQGQPAAGGYLQGQSHVGGIAVGLGPANMAVVPAALSYGGDAGVWGA